MRITTAIALLNCNESSPIPHNSIAVTQNDFKKYYDRLVDQNNNSLDCYGSVSVPSYRISATTVPANFSPPSRGSSLLERTNTGLRRTASALQLPDGNCDGPMAPTSASSASVWDLSAPRPHPSLQTVAPISAGRATMSVLELQLAAIAGRFRIEVKAIIGFARLGAGDCFEVSLKHGSQRWKTRGKTLADQTQQWTPQSATLLNCIPEAPISVKVTELRFFKSKCLNERSFEAPRFFSAQPQLVTMNLNSTGSLKLQLVITWLPMPPSSKSMATPSGSALPTMAGLSRSMANLPTALAIGHFQHAKQISNASEVCTKRTARSQSVNSPGSSAATHNASDDDADADDSSPSLRRASQTEINGAGDTSTKVFLRDKKRQRPVDFHTSTLSINGGIMADKDRWRHSSTMILDSLYRDLSKSIPSIDDLAKMRPKMADSKSHSALFRERSAASSTLPRPTSESKSVSKSSDKSAYSPSKISETSAGGSTKKNRLSSLKKSRQNSANKLSASYYAKVPTLETLGHSQVSARLFSTICVEDAPPHAVDTLRQMRRRSPAAPKSPLLGSISESSDTAATVGVENALKSVNVLLRKIETLRRLLSGISAGTLDETSGSDDLSELVGFEACMLNWEAILKLNRAAIIDELRGNRQASGPLGYMRRASLYAVSHHQSSHTPSTASDEMEEAVASVTPLATPMDQISENDSGIDSLRQHISPYHSSNSSSGRLPLSGASAVLRDTNENVSNRFKQNKERRKSLGALLDAIHPLRRNSGQKSPPSVITTPNFDAIRSVTTGQHRELTSSVSSASSGSESRRGSSTSAAQFHPSRNSATGCGEVDECLSHHLGLAISSLERINAVRATPFEYTLSELLSRLEQDTIALESLRRVIAQLPAPPNLGMLFYDLGADTALREIWTSAVSTTRTALIVPSEALRHHLRLFVQPIVTARRYSTLINNVVDSLMRFLCGRGCESIMKVTLFQFLAFFGGKDLSVFVENISHEAWITVNLNSSDPQKVSEVMDRLRKVPVVPPLESLRHIALVLASANDSINGDLLRAPIERYLNSSSVNLAGDLTASFMCILEHDDESSRVGACLALAILTQENALPHLQYLATNDASTRVRTMARQAAAEIVRNCRPSPPPYKYRNEQQHMHESRMNGNSLVEVTKI